MSPAEAAAIAGLCDASDLVEIPCPYCRADVATRTAHWRANPAPHSGGRWRCPRYEITVHFEDPIPIATRPQDWTSRARAILFSRRLT